MSPPTMGASNAILRLDMPAVLPIGSNSKTLKLIEHSRASDAGGMNDIDRLTGGGFNVR
jgi:hypothetical protein